MTPAFQPLFVEARNLLIKAEKLSAVIVPVLVASVVLTDFPMMIFSAGTPIEIFSSTKVVVAHPLDFTNKVA